MEWTDHDKMMRDRVLEKLSEEERLWWKGMLERVQKDSNDWWKAAVRKWWADLGGRGDPITGRATLPARVRHVVHHRERDDRDIFTRGFDFIFGE